MERSPVRGFHLEHAADLRALRTDDPAWRRPWAFLEAPAKSLAVKLLRPLDIVDIEFAPADRAMFCGAPPSCWT
jgi:hypothetical protein